MRNNSEAGPFRRSSIGEPCRTNGTARHDSRGVPVSYVVARDDTIYAIARRFCVSPSYLYIINSVRRDDLEPYIGDVINLDAHTILSIGDENGVVFHNAPLVSPIPPSAVGQSAARLPRAQGGLGPHEVCGDECEPLTIRRGVARVSVFIVSGPRAAFPTDEDRTYVGAEPGLYLLHGEGSLQLRTVVLNWACDTCRLPNTLGGVRPKDAVFPGGEMFDGYHDGPGRTVRSSSLRGARALAPVVSCAVASHQAAEGRTDGTTDTPRSNRCRVRPHRLDRGGVRARGGQSHRRHVPRSAVADQPQQSCGLSSRQPAFKRCWRSGSCSPSTRLTIVRHASLDVQGGAPCSAASSHSSRSSSRHSSA